MPTRPDSVLPRSGPGEVELERAPERRRGHPVEMLVDSLVLGNLFVEGLHCDLDSHAGDRRTEAEVLASTKTEVALGAPIDVVDVRIWVLPLIAVA